MNIEEIYLKNGYSVICQDVMGNYYLYTKDHLNGIEINSLEATRVIQEMKSDRL